jgi:two-component system sensor histidine kinase QseC
VRNLLDNAVRYSPRGSQVDITLDAREFRVRDNGPGISPQALARIGERFYRPPGQDAPGSGLGLSIVRRIAALHGMRLILQRARRRFRGARVLVADYCSFGKRLCTFCSFYRPPRG